MNIGYTVLMQKVKKGIIASGLDPEIGLLHASQNGNAALVYDIMEIFRQPIVDVATIRLFSRKSVPSAEDPHGIIRELSIRLLKLCRYQGQLMTREKMIAEEVARLKQAFVSAKTFQPKRIRI